MMGASRVEAARTHMAQCLTWLQIVTELVLGFDRSFATTELLAHQQQLFDDLHAGLIALPINLPGTGQPLLQPMVQWAMRVTADLPS